MGQMIVDKVVQLLGSGGIRTQPAYPAGKITRVTGPVAAVSLESLDTEKQLTTVLVEILGPREGGGYACQKKALEACALLEVGGGVCSQGKCSFVRQSDLFRVPVKAVFHGVARANAWEEPVRPVLVAGGLTLDRLEEFSAQQNVSGTDTSIYNAPWTFTVEEFFPWGVWNTLEPDEPFTMDLRYDGNIERFERCVWTHRERIKETGGIRQIRKGKAEGRSLTSE
ncbi:MAG: hypothetical protein E7447_01180 [Ruminococcaceae bacterium]|nr:hypothetical protein [Oscillospiraceae bacterium]